MSNDPKNAPKTPEPSVDDRIQKAIEKTIESVLPAAVMAAAKVQQTTANNAALSRDERLEAQVREEQARQVVCNTCGQKVGGCGGVKLDENGKDVNHMRMYVGPRNTRRLRSWPGVFINGVQYASTHPTQQCIIPTSCEAQINKFINDWEQSEEDMQTGRTIDHNSGIITQNNQSGYKPFGGAGFGR